MPGAIVINKRQLAELLGCKVSWVETKCVTRKIPHLLLDEYKFTEEHVAEILAMHERRPTVEQPVAPAPAAPVPQRRTRTPRSLPAPQNGVTPLRDRGLPLHRLRGEMSS